MFKFLLEIICKIVFNNSVLHKENGNNIVVLLNFLFP